MALNPLAVFLDSFRTYAEDLTGVDPENHVVDELYHVNTPAGQGIISPMPGAFYGYGVLVKRNTGTELSPVWVAIPSANIQLVGCDLARTKLSMNKTAVYRYIQLVNISIVGTIQVSYHVFGGEINSADFNLLKNAVAALLNNYQDTLDQLEALSVENLVKIVNSTGDEFLDGYAVEPYEAGAEPWEVNVRKPTANSLMQVIPYTGESLTSGESSKIFVREVAKFRVADASLFAPGDFAGSQTDSYLLGPSKFGFLVLWTESTDDADFVYVRYSGLSPLVKAMADEVDGVISVKNVDSEGVAQGSAFNLDVIPEA